MGLSADGGARATTKKSIERKSYLADYAAVAKDVLANPPAPRPSQSPWSKFAAKAKPALPANPDEADQTEEPVVEEVIQASNATAAAWASFCQALIGSAEFRYVK